MKLAAIMLVALVSAAAAQYASSCRATGDPHWTLPSHVRYDFYAVGLYEMASFSLAGRGTVVIQTLLASNRWHPGASSNVAIAMRTIDLSGQETTLTIIDGDVYRVANGMSSGPLVSAATVGDVVVTSTPVDDRTWHGTATTHNFSLFGSGGAQVVIRAYRTSAMSGGLLLAFYLNLHAGVVVDTGLCAGASPGGRPGTALCVVALTLLSPV